MTFASISAMVLTTVFAASAPIDNIEKQDPIQMVPIKVDREKQTILFDIKNVSGKSMWFSGYGETSPRYLVRLKIGDKWQTHRLGWCGTGMALRELESQSNIEFEYNYKHTLSRFADENVLEIQIGIAFQEDKDKKGAETIWSKTGFLHDPVIRCCG